MTQKVITIILVMLVIGGLAWYINQHYLQPSKSQSFSELPKYKPSANTGQKDQFNGKIVYVTTDNGTTIWQSSMDKATKKIFTDTDETEKLLKISNLSAQTNEVLAITSADSKSLSGKLIAIDLSDAGETVLQQSFALPDVWALSNDGKKIAYTKFSNLEENYGFTLYSQEKEGFNVREIAKSSSQIKSPAWNTDSTKIAYLKTDGTKTEIVVSDINSLQSSTIKSFEGRIVNWLSWADDKIIISVHDTNEDSAGEIEIINSSGQEAKSLTTFEGGIANFAYLNGSWLAYLVAQPNENSQTLTSGQIYLNNLNEEKIIPLGKGSQVLGWN